MTRDDDANDLVRAVMLIPRYILMLAVFVFVGELLFMLYYDTTQLVCGKNIMLINGKALLDGLSVVIPAAMLASGAMLGVHRVRHYGGGILAMLSYIILGAVTWLLVFPSLLGRLDASKGTSTRSKTSPVLTGGYFREYGQDTVYTARDFETESIAAVVIKGYEEAGDALSIKMISRKQMAEDAAPYSDILIKDTVPNVSKWIADGFAHFTKRAQAARSKGFLSWLSFASIGAVLFSVYALSFCSRWPLMSVVVMLSMYAGCLAFNMLYFSDMFSFMRSWSLVMPFGGSNETLLTCINFAVSVLFILLGLLSALAASRRKA